MREGGNRMEPQHRRHPVNNAKGEEKRREEMKRKERIGDGTVQLAAREREDT